MNQNPEQIARDHIDGLLTESGWIVQPKSKLNLAAGVGVAVTEYRTDSGPVDYLLFIDKKPIGVIEAKKAEEAVRLTTVEDQSLRYAEGKLKYFDNDPLHFAYESTGEVTRFTAFGIQKVREMKIQLPSDGEQQQIVQEIESRLSVCDKVEETITTSLAQAETLRQSILKKAFEGKLV